ncbi:MAG: LysM peptidoglycan-binding domain-containing protein, partial [Lachnospiraceae bacterium]|nr:LysM peptidoglycan-binding domain-containing protein [Lachnospiraceae bacterium]
NGKDYPKIYDANPNVFKGRSPNLIYPGDVLTIP